MSKYYGYLVNKATMPDTPCCNHAGRAAVVSGLCAECVERMVVFVRDLADFDDSFDHYRDDYVRGHDQARTEIAAQAAALVARLKPAE